MGNSHYSAVKPEIEKLKGNIGRRNFSDGGVIQISGLRVLKIKVKIPKLYFYLLWLLKCWNNFKTSEKIGN